jgi:hypothetical protein
VYDITGSVSDGAISTPLTGTYTVTVSSQTANPATGVTARVVMLSGQLSAGSWSQSIADRWYWTQDATGSIFCWGGMDEGVGYSVVTPSNGRYSVVKSPLQVGTSWGEAVSLTNSDSYNTSYVVTGSERISTPAGSFNCWEATVSGNILGIPGTGIEWWSADVGQPVKAQYQLSGSGVSMNFTMTLRSKNR